MKAKFLTGIKAICFILLFALTIYGLDAMLTPKHMYDEREPHTEGYRGFYNMQKDSIDVIILGTSHAASGFNPQDFYHKEKLRTYNLASSGQPVWMSYYWLKEALKYQSPKVVIFDVNYLFSDNEDETLNRKGLEDMRLGKVKWDAIHTAVATDNIVKENVLSYLLPFFRYHSRWSSDLKENDFKPVTVETPSALKGFWYYQLISYYEGYEPFDPNTDHKKSDFTESSMKYFEKIRKLCKDHGIQLVLAKTPTQAFSVEQHNTMQDYASLHKLPFYDFNDVSLYNACGYDFHMDMDDAGGSNAHANPSGARKMSYYLASEIISNGWCSAKEDTQWDKTEKYNDELYKGFELHNADNLEKYLSMLKDKNYTIMIAAKDDAASGLTDQIRTKLHELGLSFDWKDAYRKGYLAVIDKGNVVFEQSSDQMITYEGTFRNHLERLQMSSAGFDAGNTSSIMINGTEQSLNRRGLNVVVYDNFRKCVIDTVNFDTFVPEMTCSR